MLACVFHEWEPGLALVTRCRQEICGDLCKPLKQATGLARPGGVMGCSQSSEEGTSQQVRSQKCAEIIYRDDLLKKKQKKKTKRPETQTDAKQTQLS